MQTYDALILGGGTAGTAAARELARSGASVAMFNDGELGGLCILRGCMPTKTMLHAAHRAHHARHASAPGISPRGVDVDFAAVMRNKDAKVERFQRAKIAGIDAEGYPVIDARARFTGEDTVEAGGETYRFTRGAVIATGSVPTIPPLPGLDRVPYLTSDEVMRLTEQPESLIIVGSGAIGLELAQFFARVGTRVHLVSRRRVFSDVDPLVADEMERALRSEHGLELHQPCPPRSVERTADGVRMTLAEGAVLTASALVVATGRRPQIDGLGLEAAGVEVHAGGIVAGADMQTSNPRIYVAGDASGSRLLLHVANWEGQTAARNILAGEAAHRVEERLHMEVVFTEPVLATVGLNERDARAAGLEVVTAHARFPETGRAITEEVAHGVWKLVASAPRGELLGAQILGPRADDVIHAVSTVMYYHGTASDVLEMPWYHPTVAEVLLGLARQITAQLG